MLNKSKLYLFKWSNGVYYIGFFEGNSRKWSAVDFDVNSSLGGHFRLHLRTI